MCDRMCETLDCDYGIFDNNPDPFDVSPDRRRISSLSDTLKQSNTSSCKESEKKQIKNHEMPLDTTIKSIFNIDMKQNETINTVDNEILAEKCEESNAFQVLMTRIKPKYNSSRQWTLKENTLIPKNRQKLKLKFKQDQDKVISLPDRKRKLADQEDRDAGDQRINNQLMKQQKILKITVSKDYAQIRPQTSVDKILTHGLQNYFSKITPKQREKTVSVGESIVVDNVDESRNLITSAQSLINMKNNNLELKEPQAWVGVDDSVTLKSQVSNSAIEGDTLEMNKKRLKSQLTDKQNSIKEKNQLNEHTFEQKEIKKCEGKVNVDVDIIKCDTNNSLSRSDIKVDDFKQNNKLCELKNAKKNGRGKTKVPLHEQLAPLFLKRTKSNLKVIAPRLTFWNSRLLEDENEKSHRELNCFTTLLPFPLVSHVTQLNTDSNNSVLDYHEKYRVKEHLFHMILLDTSNLKYVNDFTNSFSKQSIVANKTLKVSIQSALQEIELQCTDAQEMWRTISSITNRLNDCLVSKKRVLKQKLIDKEMKRSDNKNHDYVDTWIQKYRPLRATEVVGNEEAAMKLRKWLMSWKLSENKNNYSSGEEFYCLNNGGDSFESNQVAVLIGPHGSGKTASVYAIAEELGYTVLEVNASSKRSGRKILRELEEATKSHRVRKTDLNTAIQSRLSNTKNIPEDSLIFVEDVDLIFDEDEGFASSIYQLSSNTKRPIVMTCRDTYSQLSRMASQQLRIYFQTISNSRAMALIQMIALAETGSSLSRSYLERLIMRGDLRKALLKLQYFLLSETPDRKTVHSTEWLNNSHETLWQDMRSYLYKPMMKISTSIMTNTYKRIQKNAGSVQDVDIRLINLSGDLNTMSQVSSLIDINDMTLNIFQVKFEPNVSLEENVDSYSSNDIRSSDIGKWLKHRVTHKYDEKYDENMEILNELLAQKESTMKVHSALSQVSTYTLDRRILSTDYLPTVRAICRSEEIKVTNIMKRGNRYFHYLQNLRIPSESIKPNILRIACRSLQEKTDKQLIEL